MSAIGTSDEVAARLAAAMGLVRPDVGMPARAWTTPDAEPGGVAGSGPSLRAAVTEPGSTEASDDRRPGGAGAADAGTVPGDGAGSAETSNRALPPGGGVPSPVGNDEGAVGQSEGQGSSSGSSTTLGVGTPLAAEDAHGTVCVDIPREQWWRALAAARDQLGLDMLDWLSAVDEPEASPPSVDVVAHLLDSRSTGQHAAESGGIVRVLLRTRLPADDPTVASATSVWPGAAWHERETHEMFGVEFEGFDDGTDLGLRPLLLPDGFEGTPLRKSFVLAARASKPWPGAKEPGESDTRAAPSRRRLLPPGVPDPSWGPREP